MFQTNNGELVKKVVSGLGTFNDEISCRINEDCLWFYVKTPDNTRLIILKLSKSVFQKYDFKSAQDFRFSGQIIKNALKNIGKDDTLYISFDEKEVEEKKVFSVIKITISGTKLKKSYEIPLISINVDKEDDTTSFINKEPSLIFDSSTKTNNKEFMNMLDSLIFVDKKDSFSIFLCTDGENLELKEENPLGKTTITLKDYFTSPDKIPTQKIVCKFGYQLLLSIAAYHASICDEGEYMIKKDYPIKIVSKNDDFEAITILAPRVEND